MQSKITVQPITEPVSLAEAKKWLKVDNTVDDDLIDLLISAARTSVENFIGLRLIKQTVEEVFNCFPQSSFQGLELSESPLISVSSVSYKSLNDTDVYTPMNSTDYVGHSFYKPPFITPSYGNNWPISINYPEAVKVTYLVGMSETDTDVPQIFKNAILKIVTGWYEKRGENVRKLPTDVEHLLKAFRLTYW